MNEILLLIACGILLCGVGFILGSVRPREDIKVLSLLEKELENKQDLINKFAGLSAQLFNATYQPREPVIMEPTLALQEEVSEEELIKEYSDLTGGING